MLRQTLSLTTASTGVSLSAAHTLGVAPDLVILTARNHNGCRAYLLASDANNVHVVSSSNTDASVDVTVIAYQGRLY